MSEENENLMDSEYSGKSDFSKPFIVQQAVQKVNEARAKEMKAGYYNITTLPTGDTKKEYIPDTRKVFIGAVEALKGILNPEIESSKEVQEAVKKYEEMKIKAYENNCVPKEFCDGVTIKLSEKYLPELDDVGYEYNLLTDSRRVVIGRVPVEVRGKHNWINRRYWDEMLAAYDYLFGELNSLIARLNYFKHTAGFG